MKFRILKRDKHNWVIERWQEGGTITRGRFTGQEKREGWDEINPVGYYRSLRDAAMDLLDIEIAEGWTGQKIKEEISAAEARVKSALEETKTVENT